MYCVAGFGILRKIPTLATLIVGVREAHGVSTSKCGVCVLGCFHQLVRHAWRAAAKSCVVFASATIIAGVAGQSNATESRCLTAASGVAACDELKPSASNDPTISVINSSRSESGRANERELVVRGHSITGALPNSGVMVLWGRHASKFVETDGVRFVALAPRRRFPMTVAIYGRGFDGSWGVAFSDPDANAHQPPTLHLDAEGRLHLLYAEYMTGKIRHRLFAREGGVRLRELPEVTTAAWGVGNFYIGTAIDESRNRIVGCAQNFTSDMFRCAQFVDGKWEIKLSRYMGPDVRLLYPNISAGPKEALIVSSGYPVGAENGARVATDVLRLTYGESLNEAYPEVMPDAGTNSTSSGELLAQMGTNSPNGEAVFDEDVVRDASGLHILLTSLNTGDLSLLEIDNANSPAKRLVRLPARWGSAHNLQRIGSNLAIIGGGRILLSPDQGVTWSEMSYEVSGYSSEHFQYMAAHTLKVESALPSSRKTIAFLQEVRNVQTNDLEVIEVEISASALVRNRQTADLKRLD